VGAGCQVQAYTWAVLTLGTGSRYSGSTEGVSASRNKRHSFYLSERGPCEERFPHPYRSPTHYTALLPQRGKPLLKGTNLGRGL
jgi:hypothetical protein